MGKQKGETPLPENESVDVERIIALRKRGIDQSWFSIGSNR